MHLLNNLKITFILVSVFYSVFYSVFSHKTNNTFDNKGKKIAYIENDEYHFLIDTTKYKTNLKNMVNFIKNVNYDEVSIKKDTVIGNDHEGYYMLMACDRKNFLKTARWLIKDKDTLYLHKKTGQNIDNEVFFRTYFSVYGSNTNCYPNVLNIDGKYSWTGDTTGKLYCDPNSLCKSTMIFLPYE